MAYIVSQLIIMYFRLNHYILNHSASSLLLEIIYCAHTHTYKNTRMWAHSCGSACYSAELSVLRLEAPDRAERLFTNIAFPLMATRPLLQTSRRERPETEMGAASEISGVENLMTCANSVGSSSFLSLCRAKCMLSAWRRKQRIFGSAIEKVLLSGKMFHFISVHGFVLLCCTLLPWHSQPCCLST